MDPTTRNVRTPSKRRSRPGASAPFAVFTAIDGTLLDAQTFDAGEAAAAVRRLVDAAVPVIPVSAMTLSELEPLARELGLNRTMILEAGGAIARSTDHGWEVETCGPSQEVLLDVVREIEDRSGASLLVLSALPETDGAQVSEWPCPSADRCFGEPFVIESGDFEAVQESASQLGFVVRRGRQFLHLCRARDEGDAFARVREEIGCDVAVAIGTAAVDGDFLSRADIAIVIPGPDGEPDRELLARVPNARLASAPAPHGWVAAIEEVRRALDAPSRRARRA